MYQGADGSWLCFSIGFFYRARYLNRLLLQKVVLEVKPAMLLAKALVNTPAKTRL